MNKFYVSAMVPMGLEVEAENFEEAITKFLDQCDEARLYGGDGIFVENLDTGETYED